MSLRILNCCCKVKDNVSVLNKAPRNEDGWEWRYSSTPS